MPGELERLREALGGDATVIHYLAVPLSVRADHRALKKAGLTKGVRIVYEKPYGTSLETPRVSWTDRAHGLTRSRCSGSTTSWARRRPRTSTSCGSPTAVRRRLEPRALAEVQIDVPETLDVAQRAEFYDATGAALDMLVTHLFQVAAEVAMEPPAARRREPRQKARETVIAALPPARPRRTWCSASTRATSTSMGWPDDSTTDTFVAARALAGHRAAEGVPFRLRTASSSAASGAAGTPGAADAPTSLRSSPAAQLAWPSSLAGSGELKVTTDRQEARSRSLELATDRRPGPRRRGSRRASAAALRRGCRRTCSSATAPLFTRNAGLEAA